MDLGRKYTHGVNNGSTIRLYYQQGTKRRWVDIPQSESPYYFYISREDYNKHESAFDTLKNDGLVEATAPMGKFMQVYCKNKNIPDWRYLERGDTDNRHETIQVLHSLGITLYEADLTSLDRFLVDNDVQVEDDYYVGYYDIETDDRKNDFTPGCQRILSLAVTDSFGKQWYLTSRNEERLLEKAAKLLRRFTILVGYNSRKFDFPYIKARCDMYGIDVVTHDQIHIDLWERIVDIYKYDKEGPSGFKLDQVAKHFLDAKKLEFDNDKGFYWNWINNHQTFKRYNLTDTMLLKQLDDKLEIIKTMTLQCQLCGTFLDHFWNTRLTDMYLLRLAKRRKIAMPTKVERRKREFPGGRVEGVPGLHENVEVWDFSQMYSTIMRSWNISPETLRIFTPSNPPDDPDKYIVSPITHLVKLFFQVAARWGKERGYEVKYSWKNYSVSIDGISEEDYKTIKVDCLREINKKITLMSMDTLSYFIKKFKSEHVEEVLDPEYDPDEDDDIPYIQVTTYGLEYRYVRQPYFLKEPRSVVAQMLDTFVAKRNEAKAMMKKYKEGTPEYKLWNAYQLAYKLMGNVVFGYMGSNKTRCYSHDLCCSITVGGQTVRNLTAKGARERFHWQTVAGDTDSFFAKHAKKPRDIVALRQEFAEWFVPFLSKALKKFFNIDEHCMEIEAKIFYDVLLYVKKKNYIGFSSDEDKWDVAGIDYIKRNTIPYTARLQKKLVETVMLRPEVRDVERLRTWAKAQRDRFFNLSINEKNIQQFIIRNRVTMEPHEYKSETTQSRIVQRIRNEGGLFHTGSVLEWVIIESDSKKVDGEEVNRFLANPKLKIDRTKYWSSHIYSKLQRILETVFPDEVWVDLDPIEEKKRNDRIEKFKKGLEDPDRRARYLGLIETQKNLPEGDRKLLRKWASEKGYR